MSRLSWAATPAAVDPIAAQFQAHCASRSAMAAHLPTLRRFAAGLDLAVESGVKTGGSTTALLLGAKRVISYDIVRTPQASALQQVAGDRWQYRIEDARHAIPPPHDLLFLDSLHTYDQVRDELRQLAPLTTRRIVFHDVTTFGEVGAVGETGQYAWTYQPGAGSVPDGAWGIRPAIDEFMMAHSDWSIVYRAVDSHGLLVLERRS